MDTSFSYHVTEVYLKLTTKKATCWIIFKLKIINHHLTTQQIKRGVTRWRSSVRRDLQLRVWPPDWWTPLPPPLLYLTTHQIKVFHPNYRANLHAQTNVPPLFIWCVRLVDRAVMIDEFDLEFCQQMASLVFHNR